MTVDDRLAHPMVVMKLDVNESSENRSSKQLFPTPVDTGGARFLLSTAKLESFTTCYRALLIHMCLVRRSCRFSLRPVRYI